MISKYSAAFLIPKYSRRTLTNDGWEFESDTHIPVIVESVIKKELVLVENYLDISSYEKGNMRVNLTKNENDELENIYFRFYDEAPPVLPKYLGCLDVMKELEFFVPSKTA
jgi:hypothetical protein